MINRRDALGALMMLATGDAPANGGVSHWPDGVFTLNGGKTVHESFGDNTVYFDGKADDLKSMVAGSLLLYAGQEPHPPHQHPEEEFMLVSEGTGEILVAGKTTKVGPGDMMYCQGNHLHGIKNTGTAPMRFYYFKWSNG